MMFQARGSWTVGLVPLLIATLLSGCVDRTGDEDQDSEMILLGVGLVLTAPSGWIKITPADGSISIPVNGSTTRNFTFTPTCSNRPGTSPGFSFFVKPGNSNLLINFMGGGACWHAHNCVGAAATMTFFPELSLIGSMDLEIVASRVAVGTVSSTDTNNPFKDYTKIYIPYCTGDLHWGSTVTSYTDPLSSASVPIRHRGFDNFLAVLSYLKTNYPSGNVGRVVVAGQSAGGYGALFNFPYIKETYFSNSTYLINDSAAGVSTTSTTANTVANWGAAPNAPDWITGISSAGLSTTNIGNFTKSVADHYPTTRLAQLNTTYDGAQRYFYNVGVLVDSGKSYVADSTMWGPASGYEVPDTRSCTWVTTMGTYRTAAAAAANYRSFTAAGDIHVMTQSSRYATFAAGSGTLLSDWLGLMVSDSGSWTTTACSSCAPPVTQQSSPNNLNCP